MVLHGFQTNNLTITLRYGTIRTHNISVTISVPPSIPNPHVELQPIQGQPVVIDCGNMGDQQVTYTWQYNTRVRNSF